MTLSVFLRNPAKCRGPKASPLDSEQALSPCTRLKAGSHAFDGMASCFAGLVHGGAFWCQRYREIRSWRWNCSAYEHQRASATEAVQRIVEIIIVRLVIVRGGRCGMIYGNGGFQRLQQISKLNGRSRQLLPDNGANRLPQVFVRRRFAVIGIDRRNDQRVVGQAALRMKLTQRPARWLDCPMPASVRR